MIIRYFVIAASAAATAAACSPSPNPSRDPHFGTVNLKAGFTPDPNVTPIQIGGHVQIPSRYSDEQSGIGDGRCQGYIDPAPDLILNYEADDSFPLYIRGFSDVDNSLLVRDPDGAWHCDDDSGPGTNAELHFESPGTGRYAIWLASYNARDALERGRIEISELAPGQAGAGGGQPDFNLPPSYGSVSLVSGFEPDPHTVDLAMGGELDAAQALSGVRAGEAGDGRCRGRIARAPDLRLNFTAGSMPLFIRAISDPDNTLVVNGPDGTWYCDDDSGHSVNAELAFDTPQSGQYDIWVGAYSDASNLEDARLEISEMPRQ